MRPDAPGYFKLRSLPGEKWRPIPGLEGQYECSNLGRVKQLKQRAAFLVFGRLCYKTLPNLVLKPDKNCNVRLQFGDRTKRRDLGRIVAAVWLDNPLNLPNVLRLNGDRYECAAANLTWAKGKQKTTCQPASLPLAYVLKTEQRAKRKQAQRPYKLPKRLQGRQLIAPKLNRKRKTRRAVRCINTGQVFPSITAAQQATGVTAWHISQSAHFGRLDLNKHQWEFVENAGITASGSADKTV